MAGGGLVSQIVTKPGQRKRIRTAVDDALVLTGIETFATGRLRSSPLANVVWSSCRGLAGPFDVILLDEPSSGLDVTETEQFGQVLTHVVAERGTGLLLVEHDMALVMEVCQHIYVMDFGKLIFEGSPAEVRASQIVQAAYLGDEALEEALATEAPTVVGDPA